MLGLGIGFWERAGQGGSSSPPPTITLAFYEKLVEAPISPKRTSFANTEWVVQTPFPGTRATLATVEIIRQVA